MTCFVAVFLPNLHIYRMIELTAQHLDNSDDAAGVVEMEIHFFYMLFYI